MNRFNWHNGGAVSFKELHNDHRSERFLPDFPLDADILITLHELITCEFPVLRFITYKYTLENVET